MTHPSRLYSALQSIHDRPAPFAHYTARDLWTDEHTSARMLELHLDGTGDTSSRNARFIEESAAWIVSRFGLADGRRVADFGCGPGLYTTRFAAAGARVTGIDFSERSLRHASERARTDGLAIDYVSADYLEFEAKDRFDLITLIMCDFCALSPRQRAVLLDRFRRLLEPGGAVLLDVYSLRAFDDRAESAAIAYRDPDGFWAPRPHFELLNTFKYDTEKVILDKYTIVEADRVRVVYNWLQYFTVDALRAELAARGLVVEEVLGSVGGAPFDSASPEFAIVARHPTRRAAPSSGPRARP